MRLVAINRGDPMKLKNMLAGAAAFVALSSSAFGQSATAPTGTPMVDKWNYKGVSISLGGFLAFETVYRSNSELADIGSTFGGIPLGNSSVGHTSEFRETARQSRYAMLVQGDIDPNTHGAFYGEFDFLGAPQGANSNESNSFAPRIRHLYGTIDWDDLGWHILAGQNWSLVTLNQSGEAPRTELPPPTIDAQYVVGFAWTRQPQLRIVKDFDKRYFIGLSLENPQTTFFTGANALPASLHLTFNGTPGSGFSTVNTLSLNHIPDIIVKMAAEPDEAHNIHVELLGMFRNFYDRYNFHNDNVYGSAVGAGLFMKVIPGMLDVQATALYGQGIGRYGTSQLPDATIRPDGKIEPITENELLAGVTWHTTPMLDIYVFGGREQDLTKSYDLAGVPYGYGNPNYSNSGCISETASGSCVGNTKEVDQITVGLWDKLYKGNFGEFRLGLQYSYTERKTFEGIGGAPNGKDNMFFTSFRYYPF